MNSYSRIDIRYLAIEHLINILGINSVWYKIREMIESARTRTENANIDSDSLIAFICHEWIFGDINQFMINEFDSMMMQMFFFSRSIDDLMRMYFSPLIFSKKKLPKKKKKLPEYTNLIIYRYFSSFIHR